MYIKCNTNDVLHNHHPKITQLQSVISNPLLNLMMVSGCRRLNELQIELQMTFSTKKKFVTNMYIIYNTAATYSTPD